MSFITLFLLRVRLVNCSRRKIEIFKIVMQIDNFKTEQKMAIKLIHLPLNIVKVIKYNTMTWDSRVGRM